jgi:ankyrin repeat protein
VNAVSDTGDAALIHAADKGHNVTIRVLLEHGADVHAKDKDGKTALLKAQEKGHSEIAQALLQQGARENAKTTQP